MKIIFLDVDGPLISTRSGFLQKEGKVLRKFDPVSAAAIKEVINRTQAKVVISSSWSHQGYDAVVQLFAENGWDIVPDLHPEWTTPKKFSSGRIHEIKWWVGDYPEYSNGEELTHWVAIDDSYLDPEWVPNLVWVDTYEGFTFRNFLETLEFLGQPDEQQMLPHLRRIAVWHAVPYNKQISSFKVDEWLEEMWSEGNV